MGVLQGETLLPLLFIININDFEHFIYQKFSAIELQSETSLNTDLSNLEVWLKIFSLLYADDSSTQEI